MDYLADCLCLCWIESSEAEANVISPVVRQIASFIIFVIVTRPICGSRIRHFYAVITYISLVINIIVIVIIIVVSTFVPPCLCQPAPPPSSPRQLRRPLLCCRCLAGRVAVGRSASAPGSGICAFGCSAKTANSANTANPTNATPQTSIAITAVISIISIFIGINCHHSRCFSTTLIQSPVTVTSLSRPKA
jgi:hypothetical protein